MVRTIGHMKQADGEYYVTAQEVAAFEESGKRYWYMRGDGSTDLYLDDLEITHGWPIFLMERDAAWFAKWGGDYEKAVETDLNPHLIKNFEELLTQGNWPHDQD